MKLPIALIGALAAASLALGGCKKEIDTKKLEQHIHAELVKQTGIEPTAVDCPSGVKEEEGKTFACTATAPDGSKARIDVLMTGGGNVKWELEKPTGAGDNGDAKAKAREGGTGGHGSGTGGGRGGHGSGTGGGGGGGGGNGGGGDNGIDDGADDHAGHDH